MSSWQVQEAKQKLSELIRKAAKEPQVITFRGEEMVVVLSKKEYDQLKKPNLSIAQIMQKSPAKEISLNFERSKDSNQRKVTL